jgi:hypothetical protein
MKHQTNLVVVKREDIRSIKRGMIEEDMNIAPMRTRNEEEANEGIG